MSICQPSASPIGPAFSRVGIGCTYSSDGWATETDEIIWTGDLFGWERIASSLADADDATYIYSPTAEFRACYQLRLTPMLHGGTYRIHFGVRARRTANCLGGGIVTQFLLNNASLGDNFDIYTDNYTGTLDNNGQKFITTEWQNIWVSHPTWTGTWTKEELNTAGSPYVCGDQLYDDVPCMRESGLRSGMSIVTLNALGNNETSPFVPDQIQVSAQEILIEDLTFGNFDY